jgi:hypothetical protein
MYIKQHVSMNWRMRSALICVLFVKQAGALPLYASVSNATYGLVVCRGLDAAVSELRQRELSEHAIGVEWLERDRVSIDPCEQKSSNKDPYFGNRLPALAGVWLSGNSSALRLGLTAGRVQDAEAGVRRERETGGLFPPPPHTHSHPQPRLSDWPVAELQPRDGVTRQALQFCSPVQTGPDRTC